MPEVDLEYKSLVRKVVAFLEKSRNGWRAKHHALKDELRHTKKQLRAVEAGRLKWRRQAEQAQAQLKALKKVASHQ